MLEGGGQTLGILERAGFSAPEPVSTGFSTRLGDIPDVRITLPPELAVCSALEAPEAVQDQYLALLETGDLPGFADMEELDRPWGDLSSFCTVDGALSGWFFLDRRGEGCHLACLYVLPEFRSGRTAAALIARSLGRPGRCSRRRRRCGPPPSTAAPIPCVTSCCARGTGR